MSGDWSVLGGNPVPVEAGAITSVAKQFDHRQHDLLSMKRSAEHASEAAGRVWKGVTANAWCSDVEQVAAVLTTPAELVESVRQFLVEWAGQVDAQQMRANALLAQVRQRATDLAAEYRAVRTQYVGMIDGMTMAAYSARSRVAAACELGVRVQVVLGVATGNPASFDSNLAAMSPEQVAEFFQGLSPATIRDKANSAAMQQDLKSIDEIERKYGTRNVAKLILDGNTDPLLFRFLNAVACNDAITNYGKAFEECIVPSPPVLLLIYDPTAFNGKGRGAIALGDPDVARYTAWKVPGFGTTLQSEMGNGDVVNLYKEMFAANKSAPLSVINYVGYSAPQDATVASPDLARRAARQVADDVNGVSAAHGAGDSTVTVIGHSYGSTTTADAVKLGGLKANNIAFVGSPGVDHAKHASDLGGAKVYVGDAGSDPVAGIPEVLASHEIPTGLLNHIGMHVGANKLGLGPDPASKGFEAERFSAEPLDKGWVISPFSEHSKYFNPGSQSLYSLGSIAVGQPSDIAAKGLTYESPTPGDQDSGSYGTLPRTGFYHDKSVFDQ